MRRKQKAHFHHLSARFKEGRDFDIVTRRGSSDTLILAIHGGGIEPGTAEIATGVAGEEHALYLFKGIRPQGNAALHLTSTRFDEPRAQAMVGVAGKILSIHGCRGEAPFAMVGGRDEAGRERLKEVLLSANITVETVARAALAGRHPTNICNRGRLKKGVQLELSAGLRRRVLGPQIKAGAELKRFCAIIREAFS